MSCLRTTSNQELYLKWGNYPPIQRFNLLFCWSCLRCYDESIFCEIELFRKLCQLSFKEILPIYLWPSIVSGRSWGKTLKICWWLYVKSYRRSGPLQMVTSTVDLSCLSSNSRSDLSCVLIQAFYQRNPIIRLNGKIFYTLSSISIDLRISFLTYFITVFDIDSFMSSRNGGFKNKFRNILARIYTEHGCYERWKYHP